MPAPPTKVFFDASVLVAAARSPTGGSSLALEVCVGHRHRAVASRRVLLEAQRNIADEFGTEEMLRCCRLLAGVDPDIAEPPPQDEIAKVAEVINPKDAHVLAAALGSGCGYLFTLDGGFFTDRLLQAALPLRVMNPGDFLNDVVKGAQ